MAFYIGKTVLQLMDLLVEQSFNNVHSNDKKDKSKADGPAPHNAHKSDIGEYGRVYSDMNIMGYIQVLVLGHTDVQSEVGLCEI